MKLNALTLLLFYVSFNVSLFIIQVTGVIPYTAAPVSDPQTDLYMRFGSAVVALGISGLGAYWTGNLLVGLGGLILWASSLMMPVVRWVLLGLPEFVISLCNSVTAITAAEKAVLITIVGTFTAMSYIIWFWFIMSFLSQRSTMEM